MVLKDDVSRRRFMTGAAAMGTFFIVPRHVLGGKGHTAPSEKLNIGAIGAGGKGRSDIAGCAAFEDKVNIVAMADPDWERAAPSILKYPKAKRFKDFRVMLEEMPEIDACTVTTPDHTHAPAAYMAMNMGKHVYVQKPLTHTVAEARLLTEVARKNGVATQMGNQGHCGDGVRDLCEMIWSGAIGQVKEVHIWTSRPVWPQGISEALETQAVPDSMNWDVWLGPAPWRQYNSEYCPFKWRGWQDFGAGALGDMACHIMDAANWALELREANEYSVEVVKDEGTNEQTFPNSTIVKYSFPERDTQAGRMGAVDVYWYDGEYAGENGPAGKDFGFGDAKLGDGKNGSIFIGEKGALTTGEYGGNSRLLPDKLMEDYERPPQTITRIEGQNPYLNWIDAALGGEPACSNFDYSGPFTEMVNFGNLAVKTGKKLVWDNRRGIVKNVINPMEIVSKEYRAGWELPC